MAGYSGFLTKGTTNRLANPATSIVLATPTTPAPVSGNLLVAVIWSPSGVAFATPPAGWTEAGGSPYATSTDVSFFTIYNRIATGTEAASYTWAGASSRKHEGVILSYEGTKDPVELLDADFGTHDDTSVGPPLVGDTATDTNNGDSGEQLLVYGAVSKLPGAGIGASGWALVVDANLTTREVFGQDLNLAIAAFCDEGWNDAVTAYPAGRTFTRTWTGAGTFAAESRIRRWWDSARMAPVGVVGGLDLERLRLAAEDLPHFLSTGQLYQEFERSR